MKNTNIIKIAVLLALGLMAACQSSTSNNNSNAANQNVSATNKNTVNNQVENKTVSNSEQPVNTTTQETEKTSNGSLATPTEAYKTAYAARKNKDIPGLKRVMSKDAIEFFQFIGEPEKKSVEDTLKELAETPQATSDESRNEKITGDRATIEYLDVQGKWKTMDFVKENGEWKISFPKPGSDDKSNAPVKK